MYCNKCGAQITEGIAFCPKCGARQNMQAGQNADEKNAAKKKKLPAVIIGIVAAVAAVVVLVVRLTAGSSENGESGNITESVGGTIVGGEPPVSAEEVSGEEKSQTPLYSIPDVAWVDLTAGNHALGVKQPGMTWDSTLFYWLEDIDTGSAEDGYLARCRVTKTLLRDAQSQVLRQYEIYSDPTNGVIYKIVSIEQVEGGLALVDYYYRDGRPDFIFSREDTVYTPTYATPSKVGERFYFNNEVMVRWRMIREPGVIGEYVLSPRAVNYSQGDYYAESTELQSIYDEVELRMFNAAYNTYDAVAAGGNIGLMQGVLQDTLGSGIAGKSIRVYRESDDVLLYEAVTDADGRYSFFVYLDGVPCYLKAEGDEVYRETLVQGVQLLQSSVNYSYGLTMHKNSGDEYPVTLHVYSCMDVLSDENGTAEGEPIQTVTATVREGAGNYSGESICTVETQSGELTASLQSGVYTVQFHADGYLDHYMEVEVAEEAAVRDAYIMPGLAETQTGVILTWDSDEVDLDLTLFTPYQAENGDMAHIGGNVDGDGHGNILVSDNGSRCEAMFINSGEQGSYKLFVNNYTDSAAGNYASDALYRVNVHVYIYNSDGFVAEYTIPMGQRGVVWEVVEVNGRSVTPAQRVYTEISGKSWWTRSKEKELIVQTCVTDRETAFERCRSCQEYDEQGNLLHEYTSASDILGRNTDGIAIYGESTERANTTHNNTYDAYGNLKTQESNGWFGSNRTEWEYVYADGRMSEKDEYSYGSDGLLNEKKVTRYDEKGRIISEQRGSSSDYWSCDYWFYGKSEEEITEFVNTYLFTGEDQKRGTLYICDENDLVLREEYYEGSFYVNIRYITVQYSYDARGNCISLRTSEYDGTLGEDWYYDETGRLVMHTSNYGSGGNIYTQTYSYNGLGKVESVRCDYDNSYYVDSETFYYYDEKGNLIRTETIEYCEYEALEFSGIEAMYYDGSRWIVSLEKTEYTYF